MSISPASGEAGETDATLSASANNDTEARTAIVRISCGTDEATVTVTQNAAGEENPEEPSEPEEPEDAGLIKSVNIWMSKYESSYYYEFEYDEMRRVSEILRDEVYDDGSNEGAIPIHIEYQDGKVSLTFDFYDEGEMNYLYCTAETDGNGRAVMTTEQYKGYTPAYMTPHYSSAGYLEAIDWEEDVDHYFHEFEWADGNIASLTQGDADNGAYETLKFHYTDTPAASSNLDINWLLKLGHEAFLDMGVQFYGVLGLFGERDACYAMPGYEHNPAPAIYDGVGAVPESMLGTENTEPIILDHRTHYDYSAAKYECTASEGRLTGITVSVPVYSISYECTGTYVAESSSPSYEKDGVKYYPAIIEFNDPAKIKERSRELTGTDKYEVSVTYY